jgi:hypothetical protein
LNSLRACSDLYAHAEHTGQELMRTLSVRVRNWCAPWAYASVPDAHAQHAHQFSYFSNVHYVYPQHARKELMRALSMHIRNWCACWACASGTDAHPGHMQQFLTRMLSMRFSFRIFQMFILYTLSMRVRNWCVHWACASGTDAYAEHTSQELVRALSIRIRCTERIPFKTCWAYAPGTDAYPEHTGQGLMRMLSMRISSWCVYSVCAPVSYAYAQHKHKNSIFEKVPSKQAEHAHKELMRALSVHVRNWCVHWACASGTDEQAQATSPWVKKVGHCNTRGTVRALFFPAQIHCCTIVYIFNILWRLKAKNFKTPTVKKKLSSVLFTLTANEHIFTESWLQIVEVAIISVGMSVQWPSTDYVHYFTI